MLSWRSLPTIITSGRQFVSNYYLKTCRTMTTRCDVRCVDTDDTIVIEFKYNHQTSGQRFFHFKRDKNESLNQTFARISLNINKMFHKKSKKTAKTKTNCPTDDNKPLNIELLVDGVAILADSPNSNVWKSGQTLKVGDNLYEVYLNSPKVKSLKLPKVLMSSFTIYPIILCEFCTSDDCQYQWFREVISNKNTGNKDDSIEKQSKINDWLLVGEGFYYETSCDDIGFKLKVVCSPTDGRQCEAESDTAVEANPGLCPFEERIIFCKNNTDLNSFRVVSYNILADIYADSDYSRTTLFPYCPAYALAIDYRKQLFIKEINGYNADIYCLQEVDKQVFDKDLKPIMSLQNQMTSKPKYQSFFSEKGNTGEGLAAFVNTSKFEIISAQTICLSQELKTNPVFEHLLRDISVNQKLLERLMARYSVIQCILCKSIDEPNRAVLLGNTHQYFHPDADHIRLIQSYIYVKYFENQINILSQKYPELKVSPILCGDFNSCPEFGVLQLMTTGFVPKHIDDFKSNSDETIDGIDMHHNLQLGSACGTPVYTNYTPFFSGCLDYIFFDTNRLEVSEVIPFPSHEQVIQNTALPSIVFPSDHLALVSTLKWKSS